MLKPSLTVLYKTDENCLNSLKPFSNSDNYSISAKCPRCGDYGSLIEDSVFRSLYQCRKCGIFSKPKPKERLHGLRCAIARQELTKALEILEIAGHHDQDGIDALNSFRGLGGVGHGY